MAEEIGTNVTKFNIEEWAPKAVEEETKKDTKKKRQVMNLNKSDEEEEEEGAELNSQMELNEEDNTV